MIISLTHDVVDCLEGRRLRSCAGNNACSFRGGDEVRSSLGDRQRYPQVRDVRADTAAESRHRLQLQVSRHSFLTLCFSVHSHTSWPHMGQAIKYWRQLGMSEKHGNFFSKYSDHNIAKYAAKICGNRPRLHIHVNLTWYVFWGDGIARPLFSMYRLQQSWKVHVGLLIGRTSCFKLNKFSAVSNNLFNFLQQQIVCIWKITTKNS